MLTAIIPTLILGLLLVIPYWQIWKKSGHSPWWSLLMAVPLVNLITLYVLAFKKWPALTANDPRDMAEHFE